jgi:hypothetical protein
MEEEKNCLLIKYRLERDDNDDLERCFVLNEFYSKKFKIRPINKIEVSYPTCIGYDNEYAIAKLYFIEAISTYTYNEIKRLFLVDDEKDYIIDELNK